MERTPTIPRWILSDEWGVGTNSYNWILLRRSKEGLWANTSYYSSPENLMKGLLERVLRSESKHETLAEHLKAMHAHAKALSLDFVDYLSGDGLHEKSRPSEAV